MFRRTVSAIMLTLLLTSMLTLAFNIQPVKASETIYIRADGSIDPVSAPISTSDNTTYLLFADIYASIVIERNSTVLDGAGHRIQGTGSGNGIDLTGTSNVTVQSIIIRDFGWGIASNLGGSSSNNKIVDSQIVNNGDGIVLYTSRDYLITRNIIAGSTFQDGIWLYDCSNIEIVGNEIDANKREGIVFASSFTSYRAKDNLVTDNNITGNGDGIVLYTSTDCLITRNRIVGSVFQDGIWLYACSNVEVVRNDINTNKRGGVVLATDSRNNIVSDNNITENGIGILFDSGPNEILHNNIIDNPIQAIKRYSTSYVNVWDDGYPSGGNYWSDYAGVDSKSGVSQDQLGSDGIGDTQYIIDADNKDRYPLMTPWTPDDMPPVTLLVIEEPKFVVNDIIFLTSDTPVTLIPEDNPGGSGVASTSYRICNGTYHGGWLPYTTPFHLASLADGVYTIEFNSTDNLGNVEPSNSIQVTLFSWNHVFEDTYGRRTVLKINTGHKFFQFITPDKDYGIVKAAYMRQSGRAIIINHCDSQLRLITAAVDTKIDFCTAIAWDVQARKFYYLLDKPGIEN